MVSNIRLQSFKDWKIRICDQSTSPLIPVPARQIKFDISTAGRQNPDQTLIWAQDRIINWRAIHENVCTKLRRETLDIYVCMFISVFTLTEREQIHNVLMHNIS